MESKFKFTDDRITKLPSPPPGKKDYFRFDSGMPNLAVRVGAKSRRFVFQRRAGDGGQYRQTLGKYPALNVVEARKLAKELSVKLDKGIDLRVEKAAKKAKSAQARTDAGYTFRDLISDWEQTLRPKQRPSYVKGTADGLRRAYARLLDRPAASIALGQLEEVWEELLVDDLPAAANAAALRVRTLCRWGVKKKKIPGDPTEGVDLPDKPEDRTHTPTGDEARKIWAAAATLGAPDGPAIQLLQVSVLRLREAIGARWSEVSDDYSKFSPSPERMKMGRPFLVWLPDVMRQTLAELPRFANCDLVFTRDGRRPLTGFSGLKKRLDKALVGSGVRPFRFHDLRRSAVTWMAENGVSPVVADHLLAHTSLKNISPTAPIYQRYEFAAERKAALELWANYLTGGEAKAENASPQLMLPAPDPAPPPEAGPKEEQPAAVRLTGVAEREALGEETFVSLVLRIGSRAAVCRVNSEIHKRKEFASEFLETVGSGDSPGEIAIASLTHLAALSHMGGITVFKYREIEARRAEATEQVERWRAGAKSARAEAEQARSMGQIEFAAGADAEAGKAEAIAALWERALQVTMEPGDICAVANRKGDPRLAGSRARGVYLTLLLLTEQIFGAPEPGVTAAYATAATGQPTSRWLASQAVRGGKVTRAKVRRVS